MPCRIAIFADQDVGYNTVKFIFESYYDDLCVLYVVKNSRILGSLQKLGVPKNIIHFFDRKEDCECIQNIKKHNVDYIILAWWPYIIRESLIKSTKNGVINFHPSYLPYCRGKHTTFWSIRENTPFGVSIHFVTSGIDDGDIICQRLIAKEFDDTSGVLYKKGKVEICSLFCEEYTNIRENKINRIPQDLDKGTFHYAKDIDAASVIEADTVYELNEFLNLLKAKMHHPYPPCRLEIGGSIYYFFIQITKAQQKIDGTEEKSLNDTVVPKSYVDKYLENGVSDFVFSLYNKNYYYLININISKKASI